MPKYAMPASKVRFNTLTVLLGTYSLVGCGIGILTSNHKEAVYTGTTGNYCNLSAEATGLPQQTLANSNLSLLRTAAATHVSLNQLQEAIWLYQEDPLGASTAYTLKLQLYGILTSNNYQVTQQSDLGGATEKYVITFSNGIKAIFKPTEAYEELATYRIDDLLQFGLVPMTIIRTIDGRVGTLQYFVGNMILGNTSHLSSLNFRRMIILDYLIRNTDRSTNNFLYWPAQNRIIAIDHEKGFKESCGLPDQIKTHLQIESTLAQRLSTLTASQFATALSDLPNLYKKLIWRQIESVR